MARTPCDTYSLKLWVWLTKFRHKISKMSVTLKRDFTRTLVFQVLFFYSLLSCWVRTRVVAISLMKLTFPAACFLHVKNSCNWRNYLGQKLRVNTNLSSAYFVNIFQPDPGSFIPSDCKGYGKAGQCHRHMYSRRAHPPKPTAFCKPGKKV